MGWLGGAEEGARTWQGWLGPLPPWIWHPRSSLSSWWQRSGRFLKVASGQAGKRDEGTAPEPLAQYIGIAKARSPEEQKRGDRVGSLPIGLYRHHEAWLRM